MDEIDIKLCRLLLRDSRQPYRELSDKLGISAPAVHKRIQDMVEKGIIMSFDIDVDIRFLGGISIMVYGKSTLPFVADMVEELQEDDRTSIVLLASGNMVYVQALLRSVIDIDEYVDFVRKCGKLKEAKLGIHSLRPGRTKNH